MINDADTLIMLAWIAVLYWLIYFPWQWYCTDQSRHSLFTIRNKLFDMACEHEISFDSESYKAVRLHIESLIRFSHDLTWTRVAFLGFSMKRSGIASKPLLVQSSVDAITDPEVRAKVQSLLDRAGFETVSMIIRKSVFLYIMIRVALISLKFVALPVLRAMQKSNKHLVSPPPLLSRGREIAKKWIGAEADLMRV